MTKVPKKKFKEMVLDSFDFDIDDFVELHGEEIGKYYPSFRKFRRDEYGNLVNDWINGLHDPRFKTRKPISSEPISKKSDKKKFTFKKTTNLQSRVNDEEEEEGEIEIQELKDIADLLFELH